MLLRSVCLLLLTALQLVRAATSASFPCGACMLIAKEVEEGIAAVDPKKVVESGSFRVNPKGDQVGLQKIPYARSNGHIVELLEGACGKTNEYIHIVNKATGKKVFINRKSTFLKAADDKTMQAKLHNACNDLIDDHEDKLEKFFEKQRENPAKELCQLQLELCTAVDVTPLPPSEPPAEEEEAVPHIDDLKIDEEDNGNDEL